MNVSPGWFFVVSYASTIEVILEEDDQLESMPPKKPPVLPPPRRGKSNLPTYKVLLVGDAAVGKSNLLTRFATDVFDLHSVSTIGVEFVTRELDLGASIPTNGPDKDGDDEGANGGASPQGRASGGESTKINLQIWDTAGQERCGMISSAFYRNAKGVIVAYDVSRRQTLLNVPRWVAHAKQYCDPNCVFMVVGNKQDLAHIREVKEQDAEEIVHPLGVRHYYASALSGEGVPSVFFQLGLAVHSLAAASAAEAGNSDTHGSQSSNGGSNGQTQLQPMSQRQGGANHPESNPSRGDYSGRTGYVGLDPYTIKLHKSPAEMEGREPRKEKCSC